MSRFVLSWSRLVFLFDDGEFDCEFRHQCARKLIGGVWLCGVDAFGDVCEALGELFGPVCLLPSFVA